MHCSCPVAELRTLESRNCFDTPIDISGTSLYNNGEVKCLLPRHHGNPSPAAYRRVFVIAGFAAAHAQGMCKEISMRSIQSAILRGLCALALACLAGTVVTGCGGGSGPVTASGKVTKQTRARVSAVNTQFVRAL